MQARPDQQIRPQSPLRVLVIVVIYRSLPEESSSLLTLLEAAKHLEESDLALKVIVADNTPGGQSVLHLPPQVTYCAYPDNPGLAKPYNDALAIAAQEDFEWLLTLDQDTELPQNFLERMASAARQYNDEDVAAVVPHIEDVGRFISPFRFAWGFLPTVLPGSALGIAPPHTSALNSASLLRVRSLLELDGYDLGFPLHNSDTRLYQRLDEAGLRVAMADVTIRHELSIMRREERMSPDRYRRQMRDECCFWDLHMGHLARLERLVRLLGRYVKGIFHKEDVAFQRVTAAELIHRLSTCRSGRLHAFAAKEQVQDDVTVGR